MVRKSLGRSRPFTPENYCFAAALLDEFLAAGGNCIDTAAVYGFGSSETTLGRWLNESGRRAEIVLVTKGCHPAFDPQDPFGKPWEPRLTPETISADLSGSLERLQTDYVDVYFLHRDDESVPVGPLVEALNQEQTRGRIRAFGASNWRVERIAEANDFAARQGMTGFVISSPSLSLARPLAMVYPGAVFADDATRQWHRTQQFPMLAWSALAGGFMSGKFTADDPSNQYVSRVYYSEGNFERLRRAQELGRRKNATSVQIGLAYVLQQAFPVIALIGSSTVANLRQTLDALDVDLNAEEMDYLDLNPQDDVVAQSQGLT